MKKGTHLQGEIKNEKNTSSEKDEEIYEIENTATGRRKI